MQEYYICYLFYKLVGLHAFYTTMHHCLQHPIFAIISEIAAESGNPAYVIGGYVRDALLNRPSKDIDIVVVGNGIGVAKKPLPDWAKTLM